MKTLIASISIVVLSVLSTTASAATLEYLCDVENTNFTHAEKGMYSKNYPEDRKVILSYSTDGTGDAVFIIDGGDPVVFEGFSVIKQDGVIRWEKRYLDAFTYYTLWTETKRFIAVNQNSTGKIILDFSTVETGTCELRL